MHIAACIYFRICPIKRERRSERRKCKDSLRVEKRHEFMGLCTLFDSRGKILVDHQGFS